MDANALILQWAEAAVDENTALKAEVARLKLQNESLEIRLAAAHDKIASLQQFCEGETSMRRTAEASLQEAATALKKATDFLEYCKSQWHSVAHMHEELRRELIRRGADDPRKPKPPCDTAFVALQLVSKWDRDEGFADLKKQRLEHLRRIDVLKRGEEIMMNDIVEQMNKYGCRIQAAFDSGLITVLREIRAQLLEIYDEIPNESAHEEWFRYPLSMFIQEYVEGSDMDESSDMDD